MDHLLDEFTLDEIQTARDVRRRIDERLGAGERTGRTAAVVRDSITDRNRENAQHSTGPKTDEGKAQSSRNAVRHGLSGTFCVHHSESEEEFLHLRTSLLAEHLPATPTEVLLVENMARHEWLTQRALRMQESVLAQTGHDRDFHKDMALYLRYQTTHQRAFHKCLADLQKAQKLRKQNELQESGFVSQKSKSTPAKTTAATPQTGFVSQNEGANENKVAQTVSPAAIKGPERSQN